MNLLDPFFLFVSIEIVALLVLLVFWLDLGFSFVYVALHGHVTPEVAALLFPPIGEASPALKEEVTTPDQQPEREVSDGERYDMTYDEESQVVVSE
jgi:hypothetical protein